MVKRAVVIILAILFATATVHADFFPVELGWGKKDLDEINAAYEFEDDFKGNTVYRVYSPLPDSDLDNFYVIMSGKKGATTLLAYTGSFNSGGDGIALKEYYDKYKEMLMNEFGEPDLETVMMDGRVLTSFSGNPFDTSNYVLYFWDLYEDSEFLKYQYESKRSLFAYWNISDNEVLTLKIDIQDSTHWTISVQYGQSEY